MHKRLLGKSFPIRPFHSSVLIPTLTRANALSRVQCFFSLSFSSFWRRWNISFPLPPSRRFKGLEFLSIQQRTQPSYFTLTVLYNDVSYYNCLARRYLYSSSECWGYVARVSKKKFLRLGFCFSPLSLSCTILCYFVKAFKATLANTQGVSGGRFMRQVLSGVWHPITSLHYRFHVTPATLLTEVVFACLCIFCRF